MLAKITTAGLSTFAIMIAGGCGGFLMSFKSIFVRILKGRWMTTALHSQKLF